MSTTTSSSGESLTLLLPPGLVTFTFLPPSPDPSIGHRTRITIPPGSTWSPGAHWHESYTEHVRVVKGRMRVRIDGVESTMGPTDRQATFQRFQVHDFWRADRGRKAQVEDWEKEDCVVEEWTDPADGFKEVFFHNILRTFADPSLGKTTSTTLPTISLPLLLQLLTTIAYVDNYIDLLPFVPDGTLPGVFALKWGLAHLVYALGSALGWAAGYQRWKKEYTPRELWAVAERGPVKGVGEGKKVE